MKKIYKMPYAWPTDGRTRRADFGDKIIIIHPDRKPHLSEDGVKWESVEPSDRETYVQFFGRKIHAG